MRLARIALPPAMLLAAACNKDVTLIPPHTAAQGESVRAQSVSGMVLDADSLKPRCPIRVRYEGVLVVSKLSGKLQYQWVRSTGDTTAVMEMDIPAAAKTGEVQMTVKPDEWKVTDSQVQHSFISYIHILSPIDTRTFGASVEAMCY